MNEAQIPQLLHSPSLLALHHLKLLRLIFGVQIRLLSVTVCVIAPLGFCQESLKHPSPVFFPGLEESIQDVFRLFRILRRKNHTTASSDIPSPLLILFSVISGPS